MNEQQQSDRAFYESDHYFDLKNATQEVSAAYGSKETAKAVAKLAGKSLFNAGLLAGKASFFAAKELASKAPTIAANIAERNLKLNGHRMTDEQKSKAEEIIKQGREQS